MTHKFHQAQLHRVLAAMQLPDIPFPAKNNKSSINAKGGSLGVPGPAGGPEKKHFCKNYFHKYISCYSQKLKLFNRQIIKFPMVIKHLTCDVRHVLKSKHKSNFNQICIIPRVFFKNLPKTKRLLHLHFVKKQKFCNPLCTREARNDSDRSTPRPFIIHEHTEPCALPGRMPFAAWIWATELLLHVNRATRIFSICSSDLKAPKNILYILITYFFNFCKLKRQKNSVFSLKKFL